MGLMVFIVFGALVLFVGVALAVLFTLTAIINADHDPDGHFEDFS